MAYGLNICVLMYKRKYNTRPTFVILSNGYSYSADSATVYRSQARMFLGLDCCSKP